MPSKETIAIGNELVNRWGVQAWLLTGPGVTDQFVLTQALALGVGSVVWSIVEWQLRRQAIPIDVRDTRLPYVHLAAIVAVQLAGIVILPAQLNGLLGF